MEVMNKLSVDIHSSWRNQETFRKFCSTLNESSSSLNCTLKHILSHKNSVLAYQVKRGLPLLTETILEFATSMSSMFNSFEICSKFCCRNTAIISEAIASLHVLKRTLENYCNGRFQIEIQEVLHKFHFYFESDMNNKKFQKYLLLDPRLAFDNNIMNAAKWQEVMLTFPTKEVRKQHVQHAHALGNFGGHEDSSEMTKYSDFVKATRPHKATDIFVWWSNKKDEFPTLQALFFQTCVSSPSSCDVERLFSTATWLNSQKKRNRLLSENACKLLYLSSNIRSRELNEVNDFEQLVEDNILDKLYKKEDKSPSTLTQGMEFLEVSYWE